MEWRQSLESKWQTMANGRRFKLHPAGFMVIMPDQSPDVIPLECNVCGSLLKDFDDMIEYKQYNCCYNCSIKWAQHNDAEWKNGWRPSQEEVTQEINRRNCLPSFIYQVK